MKKAIKTIVLVALFFALNGLQAQEKLKVLVISGNVELTTASHSGSLVTGTWVAGDYALHISPD